MLLRAVGESCILFQLDFALGGGAPLPAQILAGLPEAEPHELRFSLSHFLPCRTSLKLTGLDTVTRSSYGAVRFVGAILSSVTDAAVSRRTMSITTGLGFGAVTALVAAPPSPFSRCFLFLTRITACWRGCRHCGGALRSTAPGSKRRLRSKTLTVCPIPLRCAAGRTIWTPPSRPFPFCGKRLPA